MRGQDPMVRAAVGSREWFVRVCMGRVFKDDDDDGPGVG